MKHHPAAFAIQHCGACVATEMTIILHPHDEPAVGQREQASISNSSRGWFVLPAVSYEVNPSTTTGASSSPLGAIDAYDSLVFPLLLPHGIGGFTVYPRLHAFVYSTQNQPFRTVMSSRSTSAHSV